MNRKIEQQHWDVLSKMTYCKDLIWEYDGCDVSLEFPHNNHSIIYVVTSTEDDDFETKTILRYDSYVTDKIWNFLKNGFDVWQQLETKNRK